MIYCSIYDVEHRIQYIFRSGIRRNNSTVALADRQKVAPIMFLGKHDVYRRFIFYDVKLKTLTPKEFQKYIEQNEAFSRFGDYCCGEGEYVIYEYVIPGMIPLNSHFFKENKHNL